MDSGLVRTYAPETDGVAVFIGGLHIAAEVFASCQRSSSELQVAKWPLLGILHAIIPPREGLENFPPRPRGAMVDVCMRGSSEPEGFFEGRSVEETGRESE